MDSSLIFAGDLSLAQGDKFVPHDFPPRLLSSRVSWCINLEGPLLDGHLINGFYNNLSSFDTFLAESPINVTHAFVANNHIHDFSASLDKTVSLLLSRNILPVGLRLPLPISSSPSLINPYSINQISCDTPIILGFGWTVIGCRRHGKNSTYQVNTLTPNRLLCDAETILASQPGRPLYVCLHTSYELDPLPQPEHRDLSHKLIDLGVSGVIFHHSHVVGPIEIYKGRIISYGLGNLGASRGRYYAQQHTYPPCCNDAVLLEFRNRKNYIVHRLHTLDGLNVHHISSSAVEDSDLLAQFSGLSSLDYLHWYRRQSTRKLLLPTFASSDTLIVRLIALSSIFVRMTLIKALILFRIKSITPRG